MVMEDLKLKYYNQKKYDEVLLKVQKDINKEITYIEKNMFVLFHDFLYKEPYYHWNKEVYQQTIENLELLYDNNNITITEDMLEYFLYGYKTHEQIANIINDFRQLNFNSEMKTRLYRIPTYNSIVEGSLSNLFRVITLLLDQTTPKDYKSQNNLFSLRQILKNNNFDLLVEDINVDIRNAINHGGSHHKQEAGGSIIEFQYIGKEKKTETIQMPTYEFDDLLDSLYDVSSALILSIITFINKHKDLIKMDLDKDLFIPLSFLALELSIPSARCHSVNVLPDNKQINIDMYITNTERGNIHQMAIMIMLLVYEKYNDYDKYLVSFNNERLQSSFIRFTNEEIKTSYLDITNVGRVLEQVIERGDSFVWPPSTEEIDLNEIKYFRFPNFKNNKYSINHVRDASLEDRKRLKAHLYIEEIDTREEIIQIIKESIDWIKNLKNMPSPTLPIKHGEMEADSVYLNVYRKDTRRDKSLMVSNENFVCTIDYNIDGETSLKAGGIPPNFWNLLSKESVGNMLIAWRTPDYRMIMKNKTGRNDVCQCGSGKKYKKCCLNI